MNERLTLTTYWVIRETEGEMMWMKGFIEYAQTKSGGMMTDDKAQATWNNWMEETFSYALSVSLFLKGYTSCIRRPLCTGISS